MDVLKDPKEHSVDFSSYYRYILESFTSKREDSFANLIGSFSDDATYIDTYIKVNNRPVPVLSYLQTWFHINKFDTMLICGAPGSGKTMLCKKAIVEFCRGTFLSDASNVLGVSLNISENPGIIEYGNLKLENALAWGGSRENRFTFKDCRGALLFIDGFDELIGSATHCNVKDILTFMEILDSIACEYEIHIVLLSRTSVVKEFITTNTLYNKCFELMPFTEYQIRAWLEDHEEYHDYLERFLKLRRNNSMNGLLDNPLLFRLIVQNQYEGDNLTIVDMYDRLTLHTMERENIIGAELINVLDTLRGIAYEVYCTDTISAFLPNDYENRNRITSFFITHTNEGKIRFVHRSLYQYFLAGFFYSGILNLTEKTSEEYIGLFAERELDETVCQMLSMMIDEQSKERIYSNLEFTINALVKTQAYVNLTPRSYLGDAERTKIGRSTNIYRNLLRIYAAFSYVIPLSAKEEMGVLLRTFRSDHILLYSDSKDRIDLSELSLSNVNLLGSNLENAILSKAVLDNANLKGINLSGALLNNISLSGAILVDSNLSGVNLIGADLSGADLSGADLRRADLTGTKLIETKMNGANLSGAKLTGAKLNKATLTNANLVWCDLSEADVTDSYLENANLSDATLTGGIFTKAKLKESNLSRAILTNANFVLSDLSWSVLFDADLRDADLSEANLANANLINADFAGAKLIKANLVGTKRSGTNLSKAIIADAILNEPEKETFQGVRNLPIGIQSFEQVITNGCIFVDKTEYIYKLVHSGKSYFLSRPRRFGKSLFLSTLKAYWDGRKDLFHGLTIEKIENTPQAWQVHPVFYFDFNGTDFQSKNALEDILKSHINMWEDKYGVTSTEESIGVRFRNLLRVASEKTGKNCVVLVDEYDKPLLESMQNKDLLEHNRTVFRGFFSSLKSEDSHIRFTFITGVTKFSKTNIFSDLNHLRDISMVQDYAEICGFTDQELMDVFHPEIEKLALTQELTQEKCKQELENMYYGYRFHEKSCGVYNPYSTLTALEDKEFGYYWFATGTPSFLMKRLKDIRFDTHKFLDGTLSAKKRMLQDYRDDNPDPIPLLYQTGYLTIRGFDNISKECILSFPNNEVKYSFFESLMPVYVTEVGIGSGKDIFTLKKYVEEGDLNHIRDVFTALFASIPYTTKDHPFEHYFQTVIYITLILLGQYVACEVQTSNGRIDCLLETSKYVYIFEFKRDGTAEEALKQIEKRRYAAPYTADTRTLYKIGVNFDSATRQLTEWKVF